MLERGSVARAIVPTSAIPGLLPPVAHEGALMVDGALVSRIPADLLDRRRCGLKIAVNVVPAPGEEMDAELPAGELARRVERFLGVREVLSRSWELLGWWHGAAEAEGVDVLIEPMTRSQTGYSFNAIDQMIEVGSRATRESSP